MTAACLETRDLVVEYGGHRGRIGGGRALRAVDAVSMELYPGEFVALVGESGSGKSSLANAVFGLAPVVAGELLLEGRDVVPLRGRSARAARRCAQLIMQDPYEALDPHLTIGSVVEEPLVVHKLVSAKAERRRRVLDALDSVGLSPPERFLERRPHELSGGQRQRACIAACLVVDPRVLVADEPVSMLDVSVRAGVLHLLNDLRTRLGTAILMITHDLPTAAAFADRVLVMNAGKLVEQGRARQVVEQPAHPYTRELLQATPTLSGVKPAPAP